MRKLFCVSIFAAILLAVPAFGVRAADGDWKPSFATEMLELMQDVAGNEISRTGARPTIISRQMGLIVQGMYDAWSCYDEKALSISFGGSMRRPAAERTLENKKKAIAYAMYRVMGDVYPNDKDLPTAAMKSRARARGRPSFHARWA